MMLLNKVVIMAKILEKINTPEELKKLDTNEKIQLAEELRQHTLEIVSKTGGHLASNLGIVEITIALHSVFDAPKDKIVWDVGHQTYIHKMLTKRREQMNTLRQKDGIAGFPRTTESIYDSFDTGHSSTSISVALGMARAREILPPPSFGNVARTGVRKVSIIAAVAVLLMNIEKMPITRSTPRSTVFGLVPNGLSMILASCTSRPTFVAAKASTNPPRKSMITGSAKAAMMLL